MRKDTGSSPQAWGEAPSPRLARRDPRIIPTGVGRGLGGGCGRTGSRDHPHRRGERPPVEGRLRLRGGSSPQAWGEGDRAVRQRVVGGIIPTGVGRGPTAPRWGRGRWDHPHRRGERGIQVKTGQPNDGSSPQAWGEVGRAGAGRAGAGIIPTGVGRGASRRPTAPPPRDHPHRRGERSRHTLHVAIGGGSSPQAWGEVKRSSTKSATPRIIPTGVGRGCPRRKPEWRCGDHPHRRGERSPCASSCVLPSGSSPQAWGEEPVEKRPVAQPGIIPTGVGRGGASPPTSRRPGDHPHRRGERMLPPVTTKADDGSSPQAWGEVKDYDVQGSGGGIIPTGVGRGPCPAPRTRCEPDHPHRRGERPPREFTARPSGGSSPQAWGEAGRGPRRRIRRGIIPTGVGRGPAARPPRRGDGDHPHRRGERGGSRGRSRPSPGSSPQAWGEVALPRRGPAHRRIIPTGVGRGA